VLTHEEKANLFRTAAGKPERLVAGHIDRAMMEHYSHLRMAAKRRVLDRLESGLMEPEVERSAGVQPVN